MPNLHALKILIVEDEPFWVETIKSVLMDELGANGYAIAIDCVSTAEEARKKIRDSGVQPYDLVSLDMHLANPDGQSGDGLSVLGTIATHSAAWMVSILTGVERDRTVRDSLGDEMAHKLQAELRSSVFKKTFPRDRLLIQEKPDPEEKELIETRLKDVCSILKHSLAGQNVFQRIELPCEVPKHKLTDGTWVSKDSKECKQAKKDKQLVMAGKVAQEAEWHPDTVTFRQIRFGCGSLITLEELTDYKVIETALAKPGETVLATEIGGEFEAFTYSNSELAENQDTDYESSLVSGSGQQWDDTDAVTRREYVRQLAKLRSQMKSMDPSDRRYQKLVEDIESLRVFVSPLRRGPVAKVHEGTPDFGQAKSRVIANLKKSGQLELARHLERFLIRKGQSLCYDPDVTVVWNT